MRAQEFLKEGKSNKQFIEQLKDLLPELTKEIVIARFTLKDEPKLAEMYFKYVKKIIRSVEEAIATGRNPAARRIMRKVLPTNQTHQDAVAKNRASPSRRMYSDIRAENKRRRMWLKAVSVGMDVRRKLNFDTRLDHTSVTEGGWEDVITQRTRLTPPVVKNALAITEKFVDAFNKWLQAKGEQPIKMGHPTGSSAYHKVDDPDTEYGDIDLQMIAPEMEGKSPAQLASHYNKLMDEFISQANLNYVYDKGKPANGHPIFILNDAYVQVDFLWMSERTADWGRYRVTPMRGVKGLITGNLYSTLGEIMNMSLQSSVLMKIKDGEPVNYQKSRKVDKVVEISKNIGTFGMDILEHIYKAVHGQTEGLKVDPLLEQYPGVNRDDIQISDLVKMIKGLAKSFEMNDLFGKYNLKDYSSANDFLQAFMNHYVDKAEKAKHGAKLDKAKTPEEKAKVEELRAKIDKGVKLVKQTFEQA